MKNGIYALASLDGRPLDPRDLAVMGLSGGDPAIQAAPGCRLRPQDVRASAIHTRADSDGIATLLGDLDEPEDAARALGLASTTDPLTIVLATVKRYGDRAPSRLVGTWLLAQWDAPSATMTLLMAERVRDTCYVATNGRLVALSPEIVRLARLDWVNSTLDPTNLLLRVGRAQLRRALGDRTFLRDVTRVMPGTVVLVRAGGVAISVAEPLPMPSAAAGVRFEEAVEQLDLLLRRIVRQQIDREGDSALSLSGGLDSSLLALYAAQERGSRQLTFLTSVAPSGSGLADESGLAAIVAAHLGMTVEKVGPPVDAKVYQPSGRHFAAFEQPLVSPRHYLDDAFEQVAVNHGAAALINGLGGEMTVTNDGTTASWTERLRTVARGARDRLRDGHQVMTAADCLHVRTSAAALDQLPVDLLDVWQAHANTLHKPRSRMLLGIDPGWEIVADLSTQSTSPILRQVSPFFNRRLVSHAANLPARFTRNGGRDRALGRQLLSDALPDSIVFQQKGIAYSPNYYHMLRNQAASTRGRLREIAGDVGEWIDLTWADQMLSHASGTKLNVQLAFKLQLSLAFAEFIVWWGGRERTSPN